MWTLLISMVVVSAMTVGADLLTYFNSALLIAWMLYRGDRPAPGAKMMQLEGAHREPGGGEVSSKVKAGPSLMEDWHIRNGSVVTESDPEYGLQDNPSIDWYDHMDHYLEDVRRREDDDYYVSRTHNSDY
jgi:hypothetical protein